MFISIDINPLLKNSLTGIGVYTLNLVNELQCLLTSSPDWRVCYFYNKNLEKFLPQVSRYFRCPPAADGSNMTYNWPLHLEMDRIYHKLLDFKIWLKFFKKPVKLFHGTSYILPALPGKIKKIVTVHDLAFMKFDDMENSFIRERLSFLTGRSCRLADRVIAVSNTTKEDIVHLFKIDPAKIKVIYEGTDIRGDPEPEAVERFRRNNRLPDRYILSVGTTQKRKNVLAAVKALKLLSHRDIALVICGKQGNQKEEIARFIKQERLQERVRFLDYCPRPDLAKLYKGARALVYPSLYEGFGLPVLEALRCGTPVVASNNSSLKELFSLVTVLADPLDEKAMACGVEKILDDTKFRLDIIDRGLAYSRQFDWKKMAQQTLDLYNEEIAKW